jgi:hypothetical protein
MQPDIMLFRSSAPKFQPFENASVYQPVRAETETSIPEMPPQQMIDMLQSELNGVCKDSIEYQYIRGGIRKAHYFVMAFDHVRQEICGMLLFHVYQTWSPQWKTHRFGYIDLVCSRCPSFGKRMIKMTETFCREQMSCLFMRLNSVPEQVSYYASLGYEHKTQPCDRRGIARPWTFVRNRKNTSGVLSVNDIGVKMAKCLSHV